MIAGINITLGGEVRVLPPLNLGAILDMEDRFKEFKPGSVDAKSVGLIVDCVHRALLRNYPDTTREWVADVVDVANMVEIMQAVLDVSGLRRKKLEEAPGETTGA